MATVADRILGHLTDVPAGLDDGRLAAAIGASRSSVNNACRKLAELGQLVRLVGPDGKIINRLAPAVGASLNGVAATAPAADGLETGATDAAPGEVGAPQIPVARQGLDDVPGIPVARLPGDDAAPSAPADEAPPTAEPVEPAAPVEPEVVEPEAAVAEPEPAAEPAVAPEAAVEPAEVPEPAVADAPDGEVVEAELIATPAAAGPEADSAGIDEADIEDAETSAEPDLPASTSSARRPWWRRLLPLR